METLEKIFEWVTSVLPVATSTNEPSILRELPLTEMRKNGGLMGGGMIPFLWGPITRTPISDLLCNYNAQEAPTFCANMEMMMLNCMEQYGYERGMRMCNGYLMDFEECKHHFFEKTRNSILEGERHRQIRAGEREVPYAPTPAGDVF